MSSNNSCPATSTADSVVVTVLHQAHYVRKDGVDQLAVKTAPTDSSSTNDKWLTIAGGWGSTYVPQATEDIPGPISAADEFIFGSEGVSKNKWRANEGGYSAKELADLTLVYMTASYWDGMDERLWAEAPSLEFDLVCRYHFQKTDSEAVSNKPDDDEADDGAQVAQVNANVQEGPGTA